MLGLVEGLVFFGPTHKVNTYQFARLLFFMVHFGLLDDLGVGSGTEMFCC